MRLHLLFVPVAMTARRVIAALVISAVTAIAQVESGAFDVVSVKKSRPDARGFEFGEKPGGRWVMTNASIEVLIREAFGLRAGQVIGAPGWVGSERYDIDARSGSRVNADELQLRLRGLLRERFQFSSHFETRRQPAFLLVVSDRRAGLRSSNIACDAVVSARREGRAPEVAFSDNGAPACGWTSDGVTYRFGGVTMETLAEALGQPDGRPVVDRTGLKGEFEFSLRFARELARVDDDTPSLFVALQEQLGLKLVPGVAALQVVVVDRVERPTEN